MKKILLFLSAVAIFAACQDFLDIRPAGSTPTSGIDYTKSENIYQSISAAYASMRTWSTHAFSYICVFEIPSDNADKGSTPSDNPTAQALADFTFDASNSLINELWTGYFDIVSAANHAIHQMPLFVEAQQNAENQKYAMQCQGEAKAIRAYAYFNLTRMFGRVPIIDTTLTAEQLASKKQASTAELYDFMEKDLEEALDVLPESYTSDWAGRINRYTAMAIKWL